MGHPRPLRKRVRHFDEPAHVHELTFSCYQRRQLLVDDQIRKLFCQSLDRAVEAQQFRLLAFVIMPEHVHLLVQPKTESGRISDLLFAIKRPASFRIKQHLIETNSPLLGALTIRQRPGQQTFPFWQEGPGYDRNLTEPSSILAALNYIHLNPVRRGLCERAVDWKWSSARYHVLPEMPQDPDLPRIVPFPPDLLG